MHEDIYKNILIKLDDIYRFLFNYYERKGIEIPARLLKTGRLLEGQFEEYKNEKYKPPIQLLVNIARAEVELKRYNPYKNIPTNRNEER